MVTHTEIQKLNEHGERMARIEQKQEDMDKKLDSLLQGMHDINCKLDTKANKTEVAPKWVEWFVKGLIAAICFAGFIGLIGFIIQGHIKF